MTKKDSNSFVLQLQHKLIIVTVAQSQQVNERSKSTEITWDQMDVMKLFKVSNKVTRATLITIGFNISIDSFEHFTLSM